MTIQELNQLGDQILNEWGINNTKSLGLQACAEAIRLAVELDKYKQAEQKGTLFVQTLETCPVCDGKGETYHKRACAEDDPSGMYQCWQCRGNGKIETLSEVTNGTETH